MTTIYDIAKKANVSPMTVSRVINNTGNISKKTKEKVEKVIKELNYIPNNAARSLTLKHSKILSLLITDITNPFFTKVARGAEDKAKQMGYRLLLSNSDENFVKESEYIDMLLSSGVDGVLIAPTGDDSKKNLKTLIKHKIPFVLIDRQVKDIECDIVLGDNYEGTRRLMTHLIEQGHTNIALINGPKKISTSQLREQSFRDTLKIYEIPINEMLLYNLSFKQNDAIDVIEKLLELPDTERPTAIFAGNNFIAIDIMKILYEKNLRVPDDFSLVCFDDPDPVPDYRPFLTLASQPAYEFGYLGIQLLIERIEKIGPADTRRIVLPSEILIRKSTKSLR
ncbi:LacI family DNA-binding transcriptional regulator [Fredinandcohnia onubensis]|uniref:LacI family DNA-binding transcriptional regulator n=1 Tax=Fredinandcohnia onubensis TaxID=1571209 RepID=UPI000C0BE2DE|nr:LacI family DNA-binding transcriptional regulator [Fredinandcohnia onubensis]